MKVCWLWVDEFAACLGISPETAYKWLERIKLAGRKAGQIREFVALKVDGWFRKERGKRGTKNERPTAGRQVHVGHPQKRCLCNVRTMRM